MGVGERWGRKPEQGGEGDEDVGPGVNVKLE